MSATRPTVYTNQFRQSVAPGSVDLQIAGNGFFSAVLSGLQTTPLVAGCRVKLDVANTQATMPQVVAAADNEDAIGIIIGSLKKSIFAPNVGGVGTIGDIVEVGCLVGPVIWQVANAAIVPGAQVEQIGVTIAGQSYPFYQTLAAAKLAGIALDPAAAQNTIFRMFVVTNLLSA